MIEISKQQNLNKYYDAVQKNQRKVTPCINLQQKSELIKDITGEGRHFVDTYYICHKRRKRISKRSCANCVMYERKKD